MAPREKEQIIALHLVFVQYQFMTMQGCVSLRTQTYFQWLLVPAAGNKTSDNYKYVCVSRLGLCQVKAFVMIMLG